MKLNASNLGGFSIHLIILGLLSSLAALFGLGLGYPAQIDLRFGGPSVTNINADTWIHPGSKVSFFDLAERGNRVLLDFGSWRPQGLPEGQVRVLVCGTPVAEFVVDGKAPIAISLRGECDPREVSFIPLNPFRVPTDDREMGSQLRSATVTSRLGVPIRDIESIVVVALGLLLLAVLWFLAAQGTPFRFGAYLVPLLSFWLLSEASRIDIRHERALYILALTLLIGLVIASRVRPRAASEGVTVASGIGVADLLAFGAVVLGASLRFYSIKYGLPADYHPDEVPKVNAIMGMRQWGDLNPRYFLHPSMLLYGAYGFSELFQWWGMQGDIRSLTHLGGRTVSALAGTFSIYLLYYIGKRLYSPKVGVIAAILLAVFPLHVTCSRYMKEDVLLLFFVLATIAVVVKAVRDDRPWWLLLAGALAGFAASSKYTGLLAFPIMFAAPWLSATKGQFLNRRYLLPLAVALAIVPFTFIIGTPYSVLTFDGFWHGFRSESKHMERGHGVAISAWSELWMYHLSRSVLPGMTPFTAAVSIIALGILLWRRRREDLFIMGLILYFYLPAEWVKAKPEPQPERYIVPCLPFLAVALAEFLSVLSTTPVRLKNGLVASRWFALTKWGLVPAILAVSIAAPTVRSLQLAYELPHDTRLRLRAWMEANIAPGSKVAIDYRPYNTPLIGTIFEPVFLQSPDVNARKLLRSGNDYFVLSSLYYDRFFRQPRNGMFRQVYRDIFQQLPIVHHIEPEFGTYGFHNPRLTLFSLRPEDVQKLQEEIQLKRAGKLDKTSNERKDAFKWVAR